jgi:hypothetical protein
MQRKSVGAAVPALPPEAEQELLGTGAGGEEVSWFEAEALPTYDRNVGLAGVTTWLPPGDERPGVHFATLEVIDGERWLLRGELIPDEQAGLLQLARLTIEPWGHRADVTGALWRKLRIAEVRDRAIQKVQALGDRPTYCRGADPEDWWPDFDWDTPAYRQHAEVHSRKRHKGRRTHSDTHYRDIALAYLRLYENGTRRGILQALAGQYQVPWQTIRDWVARARQLDYLTKGKPGRAGARPGPRLLAELSESASDPERPR